MDEMSDKNRQNVKKNRNICAILYMLGTVCSWYIVEGGLYDG